MGTRSTKPIIDEAELGPPIKGYKAFNRNFTCRGIKYKVDKTYVLPDGQGPILCKQGFHFCRYPPDCHNYYPDNDKIRYAEIEAWNVVDGG